MGALEGNLGGFPAGALEDKEKVYPGSLLDPKAIKTKARGPSGILEKEQGSLELISEHGAQRACLNKA
jgi:hypothetical protein